MEEISELQTILGTALDQGIITQWAALIVGIIYVILAAKENIWCWPVGIISVILAFIVYIDPKVRLYSDAGLQVFYLGMSIYGWWNWRRAGNEQSENNVLDNLASDSTGVLPITEWPVQKHLLTIFIGIGLALLMGWIWSLTNADLPFIDAITSAFSVIATIMVAQKVLENWLYWIIINFACIFIYAYKGVYLFCLLFFIYMVVAIFGYLNWRRKYAFQQTAN